MEKLDLISDVIYNAVSEVYPADDPANDDVRKDVLSLLIAAKEGYAYVTWPDSQYFMGEDWFEDEAILDVNESSAYFIPISRLLQD